MRDIGNDETEVLLAEIEKKIGREYKKAAEDIEAKLADYWRRYQIKDEAWQRMVANGTKTKQQYQQWRTGQLMVDKRWEGMKETIANDLHNANTIAKGIVNGNLAEVYAANHNFTTFDIEKAAGVNTSFTLVDRDTVNRIIRDNPELLPPPSASLTKEFADFDAYKAGKSVDLSEEKRKAFDKLIADNKDIRWQEGKIQSVTLQSILQGESIPNMAKRIAQELGETNHKSTIRYARTAVTGAQNAGKEDAYRRAEAHGCKMKRVWRAVHDNRTRHEHRVLDGQIRGIDEPFEIDGYKIDFPADPKLAREAPYLYWNCRCYTRALIDGLEPQAVKYRPETIDGMTYDEWLNAKPKSRSITHQEEVAETMRRRTIRELYGGQGGGTGATALQVDDEDANAIKRDQIKKAFSQQFVDMPQDYQDAIYGVIDNADSKMLDIISRTADGATIRFYDAEGTCQHIGNDTIVMYSGNVGRRDPQDFARTFFHEYGHLTDNSGNAGYKWTEVTIDRRGNEHRYEWNGLKALVEKENAYQNAAAADINNFFSRFGLGDQYTAGVSEWGIVTIKDASGNFINTRNLSFDEQNKFNTALSNWVKEASGQREAWDYLHANGYPKDPEWGDYFETYVTPKRGIVRTKGKFKGAQDAWIEALKKTDDAKEAFAATHDMDALFKAQKALEKAAETKSHVLGFVTDTFDEAAYGHHGEGIANVFTALAANDSVIIDGMRDLCPNMYGVISEAILNE